jgi:hypothetical protein
MRRISTLRFSGLVKAILAAVLLILCETALAHEHDIKTPEPGFRPESQHAAAFLEALDTATIAVYPTIIRRESRTAASFASQKQILSLLNEGGLLTVRSARNRVDLGALRGSSQWEIFESDMQRIGERLKNWRSNAPYHLFMEFLLPVNDQSIFGVHLFILDADGRNAFSFLLNSHHQSFVDAALVADDSSETARAKLMERATGLGVAALQAQIGRARERATLGLPVSAVKVPAGIFDDFESGLRKATDRFGIPIGFVTFTDGSSTIELSTTTDHPPMPDKAAGNHVLKLDLNVSGWAAFAHIFENDAVDAWVPYDWSAFDEFSFWMYGNNSGTALFVDILDNRKAWSTVDDAERYVYNFTDDFLGWKQVTVRFADMHRKATGNSPPYDGLGLTEVHGWAFGTMNTDGSAVYYVDDFELRTVPGVGGTFFHETPIEETSSILSFVEGDTGQGYAAEKTITVLCECADLAKFKGYSYYRLEDPREQGDERMRAKISFYNEPPPEVPVLVLSENLEDLQGLLSEPGAVVIPAEDSLRICDLLKGGVAPQSVADLSNIAAELKITPSSREKLCAGPARIDYPINELAMYGHVEKTPVQLLADERYIKSMTVNGVSREEASIMATKVAWNTYYTGDCSRAMRLFNQAWLLDQNNQLALWGFAVIALERDQVEEAIQYFEMALQSGPENPALRENYEYVSGLR